MEICERKLCTGCHACYTKCPKNCIEMKENEEGFLYPSINEEECIGCNLCKKSCPVNQSPDFKQNLVTYAAWCKDSNEQKTSSSGGIASAFARKVIQDGGCVFGAAFELDLVLKHIKVETEEGVERLKGSKYIQSIVGDSYREVLKEVRTGRKVLFISTPCQVAGLLKCLDKTYENLITVDIVCHGTPSRKIFKEHISYLEQKNKVNIDSVKFRGESGFLLECSCKGEKIYSKSSLEDPFFNGFLRGLFYREACYECNYARPERISDVTIGDFWELGKEIPFEHDSKDGISCCLVNSEKGKQFIEENQKNCNFVERPFDEAVNGNRQLRFPSHRHKGREKFFRAIKAGRSFRYAVWSSMPKEVIGYRVVSKMRH